MNIKNLKLSSKIIILTFIPLLSILIGTASSFIQSNMVVSQTVKIEELSKLAERVSAVVHELQKERGRSAMFIGSNGSKSVTELPKQRTTTDSKTKLLFEFLDTFEKGNYEDGFFDVFDKAVISLKNRDKIRQDITSLQMPLPKALGYYTNMNAKFLETIARMKNLTEIALIRKRIGAYANFLLSKERAGIERAVGSATFAANSFAPNMFVKFVKLIQAQETYIDVFKTYASAEQLSFYEKTLSGKAIDEVNRMRKVALTKGLEGNFNEDSEFWFTMITQKINLLKKIEDRLTKDLVATSNIIKKEAKNSRLLNLIFFIFSLILIIVTGLVIKTVPDSINKITNIYADLTQNIMQGNFHHRISKEEVIIDFQEVIEKTNNIVEGFHTIIDNINIPYFIVDKSFNLKYANKGFLNMIGKKFDNIYDHKCYDFLKTNHCQTDKCVVREAMKKGELAISEAVANPLGKPIDIEYFSTPLKNEDGEIIGADQTIVDRTTIMTRQRIQKKITDYTTKEIAALLDTLDCAAKGNLTKTYVPNEYDDSIRESGENQEQISTALNKTFHSLSLLISDIEENISSLSVTSEELSAQSSEMSNSSEDMSLRASNVAAASEQASTNTENLNISAEEMINSVHSVSAAIEEMNATLNEISKNTQEAHVISDSASNEINKAHEMVVNLKESSDSIGKVVNLITDIADQTNMLALNATIEAASAGDAGKGFAVVANEVKELAKQTQQATDSISTYILEMQEQTNSTVTGISDVAEVIQNLNEINTMISAAVEEQSSTANEISVDVNNVNNAVEIVKNNIAEMSQGLLEISRNIQEVNNGARDVSSVSSNVNEVSNLLAEMSAKLKMKVDQFEVDV